MDKGADKRREVDSEPHQIAFVTSFFFLLRKKKETKKLGGEKSIANHTGKASVHFVHVFETANNRENEGEGRGGKQQALLTTFL